MDESFNTTAQREYFRCDGTVYLRFLPPALPDPQAADAIDHAGIMLRNFRARLDYEKPDDAPYVCALMECVEALYTYMQTLQSTHPSHTDFVRKDVNISGSGIAFFSSIAFEPLSHIALQIAFPGYPFAMVTVGAEVRHVMQDTESGAYRVACKYDNISEADRDLIVRFVNYLQRQARLKQLEQPETPETPA